MSTDETGSWTLPDEYVMLGDTVRRFMEREVCPVEEKQPHDATSLPADDLARLQAQAREMGVWCNQSPVEYGGAGLNLLGQCVVAEEAASLAAAGVRSASALEIGVMVETPAAVVMADRFAPAYRER